MELEKKFTDFCGLFDFRPWTCPNTCLDVLLPTPYPGDDLTRMAGELLAEFQTKGFHVPRFAAEIRLQVVNDRPLAWVARVQGRGREVSGFALTFALQETDAGAVVRLHELHTPTFIATLDNGGVSDIRPKRPVAPRFYASGPVERSLYKLRDMFQVRAENCREEQWNHWCGRSLSRSGYRLFQVVGAGGVDYQTEVRISVIPTLRGYPDDETENWCWSDKISWWRDCSNARFFISTGVPNKEVIAFFRKRAEWLLPEWERLYYYPHIPQEYMGAHAYWKSVEMRHLLVIEEPYNILPLYFPYPLPATPRLCLERTGEWFNPDR